MSSERSARVEAEPAVDGRTLRVDLRIDAAPEFACPVVEPDSDLRDVRINAVGDSCSVDTVSAEPPASITRSSGTVSEDCFCHILQDVGCVPHVRGVEGRTILLTTYVSDRSVVREIIPKLRASVGDVSLDGLAIVDGVDRTEQASVDLSVLTAKQREAVELAVFRGYFGDGTPLDEIATELEISKSALSQRLRTAQAKLVRELFDSR